MLKHSLICEIDGIKHLVALWFCQDSFIFLGWLQIVCIFYFGFHDTLFWNLVEARGPLCQRKEPYETSACDIYSLSPFLSSSPGYVPTSFPPPLVLGTISLGPSGVIIWECVGAVERHPTSNDRSIYIFWIQNFVILNRVTHNVVLKVVLTSKLILHFSTVFNPPFQQGIWSVY